VELGHFVVSVGIGDVGLGFTVVTRAGRDVGQCMVYVKNILQQGAAGKDGRLKPGDLILEVQMTFYCLFSLSLSFITLKAAQQRRRHGQVVDGGHYVNPVSSLQ